MSSDLKKVLSEPVGGFLGVDAPESSFASDFQHDDAVVLVNDFVRSQDAYDLSWGPRCLNDPDGLKGPAIIHRSFQSGV